MAEKDRLTLIFHGAVVILVGLLSGVPTTVETIGETGRYWHTAHEALIMMGAWMLAASSVRSALVLDRREAAAFVWSFLAMGYGFMTALILGGSFGFSPFEPGSTPVRFIGFSCALLGILGAFVATAVTLMGVRAARDLRVPASPQ